MDEPLRRQQREYDNAGRVLETERFKYVHHAYGRVITKTESKDGFRPDEKFVCLYPNGGQSSPRHTNLSCSVFYLGDRFDAHPEFQRLLKHFPLRDAIGEFRDKYTGHDEALAPYQTPEWLTLEGNAELNAS